MSLTVVLAVDDSPASARPVELLDGYRGDPAQIRVAVTNVQSRPIAIWPEAAFDMLAIEAALRTSGEQVTGPIVSRLRASGLSADSAVRLGFVSESLVREAENRSAGLIVLGTRGHGAVHGFALGSVAMRVAQASTAPVCLVRPDARLPARLGRDVRVMLAVDGSEPAQRAATGLASWHRGWLGELDVQIAHVQQPLTLLETILPPHHDLVEQWSSEAAKAATQAARELFSENSIRHHLHLTTGEPAAEIVYLAEKTGCELIAMGTRGLGAAHHAFVGSEALKVAARSPVPVMLFK